ncbi:lipolytic protein G-D-S-L family [Mucilaginibacter sp. HMF7410]|uniref:Lipolytic protein G-D-S-L family n=2 Tax=Mucilaginibacter arboris TaxID=2682090 RepID=A0A7K1SZY2_9SPHI|nr:lipolytic protein G-D-S-L family [Mucilaginibacter arboris]
METLTQQKIAGKRNIAKLLLLFSCFFYHPFLYAQQQDKINLNLVFIGNSITHGAGLKDFKTMAPPVFATKFLQEQQPIGEVNFSNQGVSGFTTVDFLPETHSVFSKVEDAARSFNNPNALLVFSIILGTNDSAIHGPHGAPVSPENYYKNLKTIADQLLKDFPKCRIIFHHPLWYSENTYNHSEYLAEGLKRLQSYFPEINKLVKSYAKTYPRQVFLGDKKGFKYFKKHHEELMQHEKGQQGIFYLHPNAAGAEALGKLWGKAILKVVK